MPAVGSTWSYPLARCPRPVAVAGRLLAASVGGGAAGARTLERAEHAAGWATTISTYLELMKLRLVALLVLVAVASAIAAAGELPNLVQLLQLVLAGTLASAGSGALNHYLERDLDARMRRTRARPLPSGRLPAKNALWFGGILVLLGVIASLTLPPVTTVMIMAGAAIYVGVYTIWLKPSSPWSVVIGGLSGTCATLAGWAIGDPQHSIFTPAALLSGLTLFLWSPPHFWCLALARRDEYAAAGFPTLAVVSGARRTVTMIWLGFVLTVASALAMGWALSAGPIYFVPAGLLGGALILGSLRLGDAPKPIEGIRLFGVSMTFMAVSYVALALDAVVGALFR